jgi:hypothetical protein
MSLAATWAGSIQEQEENPLNPPPRVNLQPGFELPSSLNKVIISPMSR